MEGSPQGEAFPAAILHPIEAAREVGLDGRALDVRQVRQRRQRLLIPPADQRLPPRREEDAEAAMVLGSNPRQEAIQSFTVARQVRMRFRSFGERTVVAAVVAARKR